MPVSIRLAAFALTLVSLPPLCAQQDATATILVEGAVLDKDSGSPIAGARVTVFGFAQGRDANHAASAGVTDAGGHFEVRLRAGKTFSVSAFADRYANLASMPSVTLSDGQQSAHVDVQLTRLGAIKGIVVDAESRMPLAGVHVEAFRRTSVLMMSPSGGGRQDPVVTQADGSFLVRDIPDEEVFLRFITDPRTSVETIPAKDLAAENRDKALEAPKGAMGYGEVYWPGRDADMPASPGLRVASGTLDAGEIRLEQRGLHTLTGVVNGCDAGASMQLLFTPPSRRDVTVNHDLLCGEGFRILNYPDGSFTLSVVQGGPPRRFAFQQIDTGTRGPLTLTPATTQTVQIDTELEGVEAKDMPADLKALRIDVQPENAPVRISSPSRALTGTLEADLFPGLRYWVQFNPLPKYYLKRLSFNGADLADLNGFITYGGALRLIFSDRPGTLTIRAGNNRQNGGGVAVREGLAYSDLANGNLGVYRAGPIPNDQAQGSDVVLHGMRPGTYRILQIEIFPPDQGRYEEMMRTAPSVTIEEGQTATVTLSAP